MTWYVHVAGRVVLRTNQIIQKLLEKVLNTNVLNTVLTAVESARVCPGNPEEHCEKRGGSVCSSNGQVAAYIDNQEEVINSGTAYCRTIRRSDCELLCFPDTAHLRRCPSCNKYRPQLHVMRSWECKSSNRVSHTNYRFLSGAEKDERLHNLEMAKVTERKRNKRLSEKLHDLIEKEGVHLRRGRYLLHFQRSGEGFQGRLHPANLLGATNPLQLAEEQEGHEVAPTSNSLCTKFEVASSSAYHAVQESGLIALPLERTLRDYIYPLGNHEGWGASGGNSAAKEIDPVCRTSRNNLPCQWTKRRYEVAYFSRKTLANSQGSATWERLTKMSRIFPSLPSQLPCEAVPSRLGSCRGTPSARHSCFIIDE